VKKVYIAILLILIIAITISCTKKPKIGELITFGKQEWRVLDISGRKALLIIVRMDGQILNAGGIGVRPAMWISF